MKMVSFLKTNDEFVVKWWRMVYQFHQIHIFHQFWSFYRHDSPWMIYCTILFFIKTHQKNSIHRFSSAGWSRLSSFFNIRYKSSFSSIFFSHYPWEISVYRTFLTGKNDFNQVSRHSENFILIFIGFYNNAWKGKNI